MKKILALTLSSLACSLALAQQLPPPQATQQQAQPLPPAVAGRAIDPATAQAPVEKKQATVKNKSKAKPKKATASKKTAGKKATAKKSGKTGKTTKASGKAKSGKSAKAAKAGKPH
ncbi:outer membrane biosynthesis protein TonB [Paucibacter oligotrophus]|uniref:Outer membrane biosynthesis protein TonB n=1 Tax=Roseateles oligotrophus TaxID=1769250 RepID=A0A840L454_9BURK|nr:hypothetical protein [Roseateles oligotrophus]MBB4841623.1 outer membrane biosynthesis protein TonB [Roseateles oligotrophus]